MIDADDPGDDDAPADDADLAYQEAVDLSREERAWLDSIRGLLTRLTADYSVSDRAQRNLDDLIEAACKRAGRILYADVDGPPV